MNIFGLSYISQIPIYRDKYTSFLPYAFTQTERFSAKTNRVSLDLVPDVRNFLKENINPLEVIAYLESLYNVRITPHDTLIILDEIQDCKRALLALKYFQEEYPQYDIVAAGSLLGVAVNKGEKEQEEDESTSIVKNEADTTPTWANMLSQQPQSRSRPAGTLFPHNWQKRTRSFSISLQRKEVLQRSLEKPSTGLSSPVLPSNASSSATVISR